MIRPASYVSCSNSTFATLIAAPLPACFLMMILFVGALPAQSAQDEENVQAADTSYHINYKRDLTTEEIVTRSGEQKADTLTFPGKPRIMYSPEQDELYRRMRELHIDSHSRFAIASQESASEWLLPTGTEGSDVWVLAERYLDLPASVYSPTAEMMVQHQLMMSRSADMGNIGLPRSTNLPGLQVPLSDIAAVLGFTKDVSPTIRYTVPFPAQVSIVIYSPQAKIIATLVDQKLAAGAYQRTWNGRDSSGKPMPPGDYIGEVRIGKTAVMRKYIQLK